ncbi:MAG: MASE1 domain-containing protein [Rhodoblastus sp.]|uniref:MASE1 domain-containing protein n=1 Tax=Rhodoblastus sp. TaxID=1962975 RepID=UPI003F9AF408
MTPSNLANSGPVRFGAKRHAAELVGVAVVYFALAKLGLALASLNPSASPIWPPTGFALAMMLLRGYRVWPAVFVAALAANATTAGSLTTSMAIATGNTLEALVGATLIRKCCGGANPFGAPVDVAKFALVSIGPATLISATIGVSALRLGGYVPPGQFHSVWLTWWIGDFASALLLAPVIVLWMTPGPGNFGSREFAKTAALIAASAAVGLVAFSPVGAVGDQAPMGFLAIVPLLWAALRRGPRDTATAGLVLACFAIWGAATATGPLAHPAVNASFLLVAMFAIGAVVPSLMLSAEVALRKLADERRRDSEHRLNLFIEHAPVSIAVFDRHMRYLAASKRSLEPFGLTQTPIGSSYYELYPDIPDAWKAAHKRCLAGAIECSDGEPIRQADGSFKWIKWEARPWRDGQGGIGGILVSSEDITDRKHSELALRESEAVLRISQSRLRHAADAAGLTYADFDLINDQVMLAENFARVTGYKPRIPATGGAIGTGFSSLMAHAALADHPRLMQAYRQLLAGVAMDRVEYRLIGDDGIVRWMESVAKTESGGDGRPVRAFVTSLDITSQVETRNALAAAKEKADEILASIGDGFYALDAQWRFAYFNAQAERLLKKNHEDVLGRCIFDVFPKLRETPVQAHYRQVMEGKQAINFECISPISDQWTNFSVYPTREGGISVYFRDISDQKEIERELVAAKSEAEHANQAKSKFLAAASHDLRQPVQSLVLLLSVIERQVASRPKAMETARMMRMAVDGLHGLLTSVLDISRLDAGVVAPIAECVDLGALVERLAAEYTPKAADRGLEFRMVTRDWQARTDPALLERALRNLIENALRYTEEGGILLAMRRRGELVRIDVIDTGIGIAADKQAEIFEEFHQLGNPGRDLDQGLGLGLAIVSRIASLLGTQVDVASRVGRGSRFSLSLPRVHDAAPVVAVSAPIDDPGGRVLIVEDNAVVRIGLEAMLKQFGYETLSAVCGEDALELAEKQAWSFAAIVADYRLGAGLTGIETAREIQRVAGRPIAVLVLTGDTAVECIAEIEASGFKMLHKPLSAEQLRRELAQLIKA